MSVNTSIGSLTRRRSPSVDDWSDTPLETPNTRKHQRLDYAQLHSRGKTPSPAPVSTVSPNRRRLAPMARIQSLQPRAQLVSNIQPRPLFLPDREPILQPSRTVVEVTDPSNTQKTSGIAKHKWWWAYFTVQILDTRFHKGKTGTGDLVWNEHYKCKASQHCQFDRYADKLKSSTTALSDHITKYYHLTENHDPNSILSYQPRSASDIRTFVQEKDEPTFEDALLDWITYSNQPFTITECEYFPRMLRAVGYQGRIPKADAIKYKLEARISVVTAKIIDDIEKTATTVCLTLDGWKSKNNLSMLAINIRWLDHDFKRHQHCIEFIEVQGSYSGENLAILLLATLKQYNICHRLLTITADNASNNDTLCVYL